jgi:hypothetical protein
MFLSEKILISCHAELVSASTCRSRNKFGMTVLLIMANLLESPLELRNTCAGYSVHVAAVAALEEVVGNTCDHCTVVAAKLERREDAVEVASLSQHGAQA